MAGGGQLDLWGGDGGGGALRWVPIERPGRLGIGPIDLDPMTLRAEHRVTVVVAVTEDASEVVERATGEDVDVRHLVPSGGEVPRAELGRHAIALAADARAGRRVVVIGDDPLASLVVAAALVELGQSASDAAAAAGIDALGRDALAALAAG